MKYFVSFILFKCKFQVVVAYNPLGWNRTEIVRIPVSMCFVFSLCYHSVGLLNFFFFFFNIL